MPSERIQRRIDGLLDEIEAASGIPDWPRVRELCDAVLRLDHDNADARAFLDAARFDTSVDLPSARTADVPSSPGIPDPTRTYADGRYTLSRLLGEGGKKLVYLAHDSLLDRDVAFALIKSDGFDDTSRERITREAQAMGRLGNHPNIVAVLDLGQEDDGTVYMVTELMGGGDVEVLLEDAEENRLSLERVIEIGKAVCDGLEFAHANGIVHRDLKPGNVWLTEAGVVKIGDFGLAVMTDRSRLTREGMMVGTVSYMPPEQATGGEITPRSDLYSLGAMLYEMVTGRPPFLGDDEIAIIGQHINTPPVAPTWHNGACPRPLGALIERLLSKDPSERPDSAQDVYKTLDTIDLTARGEMVEQDQTSLESLAGGVFVGRRAEMDTMKTALEDVLSGRGRLIALAGEPGAGKTRLAEELATYAGLRGARVLWGRCYEGAGAPPYWPWVQAIRDYVRETDPDDLRRQLGSNASVVAEIVPDVKDRLPEVQPPPGLDDPEAARFRLFDNLATFIKSVSETRPLVIVLDDLHWADRPSLSLLEFVARELQEARVMLVATYRDVELDRRHPLTATLGELAREQLYERISLSGLGQDDIARFIEIAAGFASPDELAATVHRHTEGNPLFITEVVRDLVQSGELTSEKTTGRSTWSVRIPGGVREVIGRRLDRLSEAANETLTTASIIGRDFTLEALRSLHGEGSSNPISEDQLLDLLDEALDAKIIVELTDGVGHYQYTHALIQETLAAEISATRRVRLHARIAQTLEEIFGDRVDDHAGELAIHFAEAEPVLGTERLIYYSIVAGETAFAAHAHETALDHFERAVEARHDAPLDAVGARALGGRGIARAANNLEREAAGDVIEAFQFWVASGDSARALELAFRPDWSIVILAAAARMFVIALDLVEPGSHESAQLLVPSSYGRFAASGTVDVSMGMLDEAISIAQRQGDHALEVQALAMKANILGWALEFPRSMQSAEQALAKLEEEKDPIAEVRARLFFTHGLVVTGDSDRAEGEVRVFLSQATKIGVPSYIQRALNPAVTLASLEGRWEDVKSYSEQLRELTPEDPTWTSWLAGGAALRGADDEVNKLLAQAGDLLAGAGPLFTSYVHGVRGHVLLCARRSGATAPEGLDSGETLEAVRAGGMAARRAAPALGNIYLAYHADIFTQAVIAGGDVVEIEELYELYMGMSASWLSARGFAGLDWCRAELAQALDRDPSEIAEHRKTEIDFMRRAGYRPSLALALNDYAELLLESGKAEVADGAGGSRTRDDNTADLQNESLSIAQDLGMRPLTERILARRKFLRA